MERKKIKILVWQGSSRGGAEQVMNDIVLELRKHKDCDVSVGRFSGEGDFSSDISTLFVPRIFPRRYVAYNTMWACLFLSRRLRKSFDLVYTHTAACWSAVVDSVAYHEPGDLRKMRQALSFRSKSAYFLAYWCAVWEIKHARIPIAASCKAKSFMEDLGVEPLVFSANGIDTQLPKKEEANMAALPRFVFIGRKDPIKNFEVVEKSVKSWGTPCQLDVYGFDGVSVDRIKYHGWTPKEEVHQRLAKSADALIVSSLFEAFPLVVIEALCVGVPVIISKAAVPDELVKYCIVFDGSVAGLTRAFELLKDNHATIVADLWAIRERIISTYDKSTVYAKEVNSVLRLLSADEEIKEAIE